MKNYIDYIINSKNLINNVKEIRKCVGDNVKICAMVKANAYGHGLIVICKIIGDLVDFFGVVTVNEAKQIRKINKTTPILIVSVVDKKYYKWCAKNNVSITIANLSQIDELLELENKLENNLNIHIKVNTGLNRLGFKNTDEFLKIYNSVINSKKIILQGIFTHFASKQEDESFIEQQFNIFHEYLKLIDTKNLIVHCCNSYATMHFKKFHCNMVRCGISIYGVNEYDGYNFKPVATITTKIISIKNIKKGETVGYSRTFKAKKDMVVGVVAIGYADGFDRRLSNKFRVLVNNKWVKVIGLICMDACMIDLTSVKNVKLFDKVTILGKNGNKQIDAHYYANCLKTSYYEVFLKFNHNRTNDIIE